MNSDIELRDFDGKTLKANRTYVVSGDNLEMSEQVVKSICVQLRHDVPYVNCFCEPRKKYFYQQFIPPAFIDTSFSEKKMISIFEVQEEAMKFCDSKGRDANEREIYKDLQNRLVIIDRTMYCKSNPWVTNHDLNNGLMNAAKNHITIIYCNIQSDSWKTWIPAPILGSAADVCFIVSSTSGAHGKQANMYFGAKIAGRLSPQEYIKVLQKAVNDEKWQCAALTKSPSALPSENPEEDDYKKPWTNFLLRYNIPHGLHFKFGRKSLWDDFVEKKQQDETGSVRSVTSSGKERYDSSILDLMNTVPANKKLLIAVVPK